MLFFYGHLAIRQLAESLVSVTPPANAPRAALRIVDKARGKLRRVPSTLPTTLLLANLNLFPLILKVEPSQNSQNLFFPFLSKRISLSWSSFPVKIYSLLFLYHIPKLLSSPIGIFIFIFHSPIINKNSYSL